MEQHRASRADVFPGTSGDGECGVGAIIEEFAFDGDVAGSKHGCEVALPLGAACHNRVNAVAVVSGDLLGVVGVENGVVEAQHITDAVGRRMELLHRVGQRVLHDVDHLGMPVDPGNLLVLGRHGNVPVIGAPGCARSPKENGFDWVLQRVIAGIDISPLDFARMGVGGLLMEIETRPRPREISTPRQALQVCGLVLGAGSSSRMGGPHKLRALFDGVPLLVRAVKVLSSGLSRPPIVVLGHDADGMKTLLAGTDAVTIINPDYAEGLSTSLRLGIGAVPTACDLTPLSGVTVQMGRLFSNA